MSTRPTGGCPSDHHPYDLGRWLGTHGRFFGRGLERRRFSFCRCRAFAPVVLSRSWILSSTFATHDGTTYGVHFSGAAGGRRLLLSCRDLPRAAAWRTAWVASWDFATGRGYLAPGGRTSQRRRRWDALRAIVAAWENRAP